MEEPSLYMISIMSVVCFGFFSLLGVSVTILLAVLSCLLSYFIGTYTQTGVEIGETEIIEHYRDGKTKKIPFEQIKRILLKGDRAYFTFATFRTVILKAKSFDNKSVFLLTVGRIIEGTKKTKII